MEGRPLFPIPGSPAPATVGGDDSDAAGVLSALDQSYPAHDIRSGVYWDAFIGDMRSPAPLRGPADGENAEHLLVPIPGPLTGPASTESDDDEEALPAQAPDRPTPAPRLRSPPIDKDGPFTASVVVPGRPERGPGGPGYRLVKVGPTAVADGIFVRVSQSLAAALLAGGQELFVLSNLPVRGTHGWKDGPVLAKKEKSASPERRPLAVVHPQGNIVELRYLSVSTGKNKSGHVRLGFWEANSYPVLPPTLLAKRTLRRIGKGSKDKVTTISGDEPDIPPDAPRLLRFHPGAVVRNLKARSGSQGRLRAILSDEYTAEIPDIPMTSDLRDVIASGYEQMTFAVSCVAVTREAADALPLSVLGGQMRRGR